ncbi:MAG: hypothetical protein GEU78_19525, partial [Actinobacteria bacterium]|nr:hypothetical protein [Actinomycetota bacterium]
VMSAVTVYGTPLVEDPARAAGVEMLGVDETSFLKATPTAPTWWVSAAVDIGRRRVVDLFEGRNATDLDRWLTERPESWKAQVKVTRGRSARTVHGLRSPASWATPCRWQTPSTSSPSAPAPWTPCTAACSRRPSGTAAARATRCTGRASSWPPPRNASTLTARAGWRACWAR